jgi:hypothetical protein
VRFQVVGLLLVGIRQANMSISSNRSQSAVVRPGPISHVKRSTEGMIEAETKPAKK